MTDFQISWSAPVPFGLGRCSCRIERYFEHYSRTNSCSESATCLTVASRGSYSTDSSTSQISECGTDDATTTQCRQVATDQNQLERLKIFSTLVVYYSFSHTPRCFLPLAFGHFLSTRASSRVLHQHTYEAGFKYRFQDCG